MLDTIANGKMVFANLSDFQQEKESVLIDFGLEQSQAIPDSQFNALLIYPSGTVLESSTFYETNNK